MPEGANHEFFGNILEQAFESEFESWKLIARLIVAELDKVGVPTSESQLSEIVASLRDSEGASISLPHQESDLHAAGVDAAWFEGLAARIAGRPVERLMRTASRAAANAIPAFAEQGRDLLLDAIEEQRSALLARLRADRQRIARRVRNRWKSALEELEILIWICGETGSAVNVVLRTSANRTGKALIEAVTRLHARACQTASEILTLLTNGLADGAMARWRTLHEISIVCEFIRLKGNPAARAFLDHEWEGAHRLAKAYREQHPYLARFGHAPISDTELARLATGVKRVARRHANAGAEADYRSDLGWASKFIEKKGRPHLSDLAAVIGLSHMQPWYVWSHDRIHANARGSLYSMGLQGLEGSGILLSGGSEIGLVEVGQVTALTLFNATCQPVLLRTTTDALISLKVASTIRDRAIEAFVAVNERMQGARESMVVALRDSPEDF